MKGISLTFAKPQGELMMKLGDDCLLAVDGRKLLDKHAPESFEE